LGSRELL
jgi:hypothetical protein